MEYTHDVFISYKRYGEWTTWVQNEFYKVLNDHLSMELGRTAHIWIDGHLESGVDWPDELANKLTTSRVLVPLFSKMYFGSEWCLREFSAARFKESNLGFRTRIKPNGIIVPGRIHDGKKEDLPLHLHECCRIQSVDLTKYALTSLSRNCPDFVFFEEAIKTWVKQSIKPAIDRTLGTKPEVAWLTQIADPSFDCLKPADFNDPGFPSLG